jgi:hypothetical protein
MHIEHGHLTHGTVHAIDEFHSSWKKQTLTVHLKILPEVAEATNNPTTVRLQWVPYHPAVPRMAGVVISRQL